MTRIDLCVVSYNVKDKVDRLISTLYEFNDPGLFTLTIVDNSSTDGTYDYLQEIQESHGFALHKNPNVGYSASCNYGASLGDSEFIALLNSDIWFSPGSIEQIIKDFDENKDVAVFGPKQRDERGSITHAGIIGTNVAPKHRGWQESDPHDSKYRDIIECVTVSGSAYFIRRSVWDEVINIPQYMKLYNKFGEQSAQLLRTLPKYWLDNPGAFLSTPFYYEETACSYLIRHLGHKVCYNGNVSIGHSWHSSHEKNSVMDKMFRVSQSMFREMCDSFSIERD